jgi:S1-C subfamily serine protease
LGQSAKISAGSGIAVGTQGEILTNSHVVEGCEKIVVRLSSGNLETAVLVGRDEKNDLALVRATTALGGLHPVPKIPS